MTMSQGPAIWEHFGHNALVVEDPSRGTSVAWNWGLFDFRQADFIPRFLKGEMMYWMDGFDASALAASYQRQGRTVWLDELALTQEQARELQRLVAINALPENRFYRYDYFVDNCSTRVRDVLDEVLGGALQERFGPESAGFGYRHETERLTQRAILDFLGITLLLGPRGDATRTQWEQMFTPLYLRERLREMTVPDADGGEVPLIRSERVLFSGTRPLALQEPPDFIPRLLVVGVVLGGLLAGLGALAGRSGPWSRIPLAVIGGIWSLAAGVGGLIMILVYGTAHIWMFGNENVLQLSPVSLILAVAVPVVALGSGTARRTRVVAWVVAALASLGFVAQAVPGIDQANGVIIALALPAHLGLAWGLNHMAKRRSES
jgi:hypothetical protein